MPLSCASCSMFWCLDPANKRTSLRGFRSIRQKYDVVVNLLNSFMSNNTPWVHLQENDFPFRHRMACQEFVAVVQRAIETRATATESFTGWLKGLSVQSIQYPLQAEPRLLLLRLPLTLSRSRENGSPPSPNVPRTGLSGRGLVNPLQSPLGHEPSGLCWNLNGSSRSEPLGTALYCLNVRRDQLGLILPKWSPHTLQQRPKFVAM